MQSVGMATPTPMQAEAVAELLGRAPQCRFAIAVAHPDGRPVVIANAPLLDDGTPMPTRYWLLDADLRRRVSRLEGDGGVRAAENAVGADVLAAAHERYAADRDALLPEDYSGPRPTGGVGGTARGVKCLHAHLAYRLAGGNDPVGDWVLARLGDMDQFVAIGRSPSAADGRAPARACGGSVPASAPCRPALASDKPGRPAPRLKPAADSDER